MKKALLNNSYLVPDNYSNGQGAEFIFSGTFYGKPKYADNIDSRSKADIGIYQVKGERATICDGIEWRDFINHVKKDACKMYAYVTGNKRKGYKYAYIMSKREYIDFVAQFSELDSSTAACDKAKAEGTIAVKDKRRFNRQFKTIEQYLDNQVELTKLR